MKLVTIVGARPQFIKAAAVSMAVRKHNDNIRAMKSHVEEIIVHTGQHYDQNMSQIFFDELEIPTPDYNLNIGSEPHGRQTGKMLSGIEEVLEREMPDCVVVYGDTNSTLAGALAASKLHITLAHVEAGLRSFNRHMPEEINRVITDHISDILFCPTKIAVKNLEKEGFTNIINRRTLVDRNSLRNVFSALRPEHLRLVLNVGDVMYDSVLYYSHKADSRSNILKQLKVKEKDYALATVHRPENTDDISRLSNIVKGLEAVSKELLVIWPVHPRNIKFIDKFDLGVGNDRFRVIEPTSYVDFIKLEKHAKMIFTDSGGVQKEAYFLQVPCITLRDETEWTETIQSGMNRLAGASQDKIFEAFKKIAGKACGITPQVFGDGLASERIVEVLIRGNKNAH
jgi:UDP-GlcNAc3NAcA epimerase